MGVKNAAHPPPFKGTPGQPSWPSLHLTSSPLRKQGPMVGRWAGGLYCQARGLRVETSHPSPPPWVPAFAGMTNKGGHPHVILSGAKNLVGGWGLRWWWWDGGKGEEEDRPGPARFFVGRPPQNDMLGWRNDRVEGREGRRGVAVSPTHHRRGGFQTRPYRLASMRSRAPGQLRMRLSVVTS